MSDPTHEDWHEEVHVGEEGISVDILILDGDVDDDGRPVVTSTSVLEGGYLVDADAAMTRKVARFLAAGPTLYRLVQKLLECKDEELEYWERHARVVLEVLETGRSRDFDYE